jgi:hypothetical protein
VRALEKARRAQEGTGAWRSTRTAVSRWLKPAAVGLALAVGLAIGVVGVITRWFGLPPEKVRPRQPRVPLALPAGQANQPVRVSGGTGTLLAAGTGLVVVLLAAGAAQAWVYDQRPDDFDQPLPERRLIGADRLTGYHWVDQEAGLVQIPVERAMDLLAERGLPARSEADSGPFQDEGFGGPTDASGGRWPWELSTPP